MTEEKNLDKIFVEALELLEMGIDQARILEMHPKYKAELLEMFQTIFKLEEAAQDMSPTRTDLKSLLADERIEEAVTKITDNSLPKVEAYKGRASFTKKLTNQIRKLMNINWKIAGPALVALVLVVFFVSKQSSQNQANLSTNALSEQKAMVSSPATSGNVDDVVDSLLSTAANEEAIINEQTSSEESFYNIEASSLSDFGQAYNTNEF